MENNLSIIILTYNHLKETIITIDCFKKQNYKKFNIIVVDNKSEDNTCTFIKEKYPEIVLIENSENYGWAKGNNIGIKYALEKGANYILLANNDLFFDDSTIISTLVKNFEELPTESRVGAMGTRQYSYFEQDKLEGDDFFYFSKSKKRNKELNIYRCQNKVTFPLFFKKVDYIIGAFVLIKSEVIEEIGFFDEDLYFTWEDLDFCYRIWQHGFACIINHDLKIYHKVSTSCKINSAYSTYYRIRNMYLFQKKHKKTIPNYSYYLLLYYYKFFKHLLRIILFPSRLSDSRFKVFQAAIHGFTDVIFFNRKGKRY